MKPTPVFDPNSPFYPPLASYMQVDLVTNASGSIWILHSQPLPALLKWLDYDVRACTLTLAMDTGKIQVLGVKVPAAMTGTLRDATQAGVMLMENRQVADFTVVPLNTIQD